MKHETVENGAERTAAVGYDAAVARREDDVLRRWPFAAEIYQAIITSPPEWSTRVGVYAPWGVGKTSVLKFVEAMAEADRHLVVTFNPWMHPTSEALWGAFVRAIASKLKERTGKVAKGAAKRVAKGVVRPVGALATKILSTVNEAAGAAAEMGLAKVQDFFAFGKAEVAELRAMLGDKRLIVLIDDLDRADPRLVPEILLALKEILDVPSVAFVCAFDPKIVGQAMHEYHRGFDDGLKFLEKIIDYPCWLPDARREDLERLALRDAERHCSFVPVWAIKRVLPWVATTPRSIRQFVRGLCLLESSARRYREEELNWVVSLCAQVLHFRLPECSAEILGDNGFWTHLAEESFAASLDKEENNKAEVDIRARVGRLVKAKRAAKTDVSWLVELLSLINRERNSELWTSGPKGELNSLPTAVTGKELDEFLERQQSGVVHESMMRDWLAQCERGTGADAHGACLHRLIALREIRMQEAYQTFINDEKEAWLRKVNHIDAWLRVLLLEIGRSDAGWHRWTAEDLKALRDHFARCNSSRELPEEIAQRKFEVGLLLDLVRSWSGELRIWGDVIGTSVTHGEFDGRGPAWIDVWQRLREAWNTRLAEQLATEFFSDPELVTNCRDERLSANRHVLDLLEDSANAFWQGQREGMLTGLRDAKIGVAAWRNAFELVSGILPKTNKGEGSERRARALLSDGEVAQALFSAATSRVLVEKGVYRLLSAVRWCERNSVVLVFPEWWAGVKAKVETREKAENKTDAI